jgi:CheY-like chemotaxis protein
MLRVLVVDDHESVRVMVRELLKSEGCEVSCAADGLKGLALVQE